MPLKRNLHNDVHVHMIYEKGCASAGRTIATAAPSLASSHDNMVFMTIWASVWRCFCDEFLVFFFGFCTHFSRLEVSRDCLQSMASCWKASFRMVSMELLYTCRKRKKRDEEDSWGNAVRHGDFYVNGGGNDHVSFIPCRLRLHALWMQREPFKSTFQDCTASTCVCLRVCFCLCAFCLRIMAGPAQ